MVSWFDKLTTSLLTVLNKGRFFSGTNMNERQTHYDESREVAVKPVVGLRLQDVLMRVDTAEPAVLDIRRKVLARLESNPGKGERTAMLEVLSNEILGLGLKDVKREACKVLVPYHDNGEKRRSLIISSASSASASQETERGILEARGHIIDIPGAIEGRDTRSARDGDVALISTRAGLMMAKAKGTVRVINIADETVLTQTDGKTLKGSDIYYKADGLLLLMLTNPQSNVISQIANELINNSMIYPYNLDEETQIALLWLTRKTGITQIDVNANSPEVAVELTRKGYRYPTIEAALQIPDSSNPYVMQEREWLLSQAATEINHHPDCVPGYVIDRSENLEEMYQRMLASCMLLVSRYSLETGWVKPDRGTDGGNQGPVEIGVDNHTQDIITSYLREGNILDAINLYEAELSSLPQIKQRIEDMWKKGGSWLIEAKTNYFDIKFTFDGAERVLKTTPSVHIIKGEPRYTISLQLVDDMAWGGNLICSQETWNKLVECIDQTDERIVKNPSIITDLKKSYELMTEAMRNYAEAINTSKKYRNGQVRGGADLAICTLGGKFGDKLVVAVQDYNARANGCETAYALYDQAQEIYMGKGEAVTRNITPMANFDAFTLVLPVVIKEVNQDHGKQITMEQMKIIAVSAGWGQIGMIGTDALEILQEILLVEEKLRKMGIIQ